MSPKEKLLNLLRQGGGNTKQAIELNNALNLLTEKEIVAEINAKFLSDVRGRSTCMSFNCEMSVHMKNGKLFVKSSLYADLDDDYYSDDGFDMSINEQKFSVKSALREEYSNHPFNIKWDKRVRDEGDQRVLTGEIIIEFR